MPDKKFLEFSYFPGCSLETTAKENNRSLNTFCERHDIALKELDDWNCCGSSSTHSIDHDPAKWLPTRNLALAPPGRPLMAACPNCYMRLKLAHMMLNQNGDDREEYKRLWGRDFDPDLRVITFSELLSLSLGIGGGRGWFRRQLIDPRPLLRARKLIG